MGVFLILIPGPDKLLCHLPELAGNLFLVNHCIVFLGVAILSRIFLKYPFSKGLVPSLRLLGKNGNYEVWGLMGVFVSFGGGLE